MEKTMIRVSKKLAGELKKLKRKEGVSSYENLLWLLIKDYTARHVYRKLLKELEEEEK